MAEQIKIEGAWTNVGRKHDQINTTERWSNQVRRQILKSRQNTENQIKVEIKWSSEDNNYDEIKTEDG